MSQYKQKINPLTGQFNLIPSNIAIAFKEGVATVGDLPAIGNTKNDARIVNDTHHLYVWDGATWQDQGDIIDMDWSAITGKPTSTPAEIDDAVSKRHTQGTDQGLDTGGVNETTAAEVKSAVDDKHTHANKVTLDAIEEALTSALKTAYDDAVTKVHTQGTDTQLDSGVLEIDADDCVKITKNIYFLSEVDNGNGGVAKTINWKSGNKQLITLDSVICALTFTAPSGACNLTLRVIQDASGNRTLTYPANVKWAENTEPTLSTAGNVIDILTFYYDGTNYYGMGSLNFA